MNLDPEHNTNPHEPHNDEHHPIEDINKLFSATKDIGDWKSLCNALHVDNAIMQKLEFSTDPAIHKKRECLTDYFNNQDPDWRAVVTVIAEFPIRNIRIACKIAEKYMKWNRKECSDEFQHRDEL